MSSFEGQSTDAENNRAKHKATNVGSANTLANSSAQAIAKKDQRDKRQGNDAVTAPLPAGD